MFNLVKPEFCSYDFSLYQTQVDCHFLLLFHLLFHCVLSYFVFFGCLLFGCLLFKCLLFRYLRFRCLLSGRFVSLMFVFSLALSSATCHPEVNFGELS